jgi:hypothetical protein
MTRVLILSFILAALGRVQAQSEPAPRTLTPLPLTLTVDLAQVAAVRELGNGHLLISDAGTPAILVVDPASGATRKLGREGRGPNEFVRPGGIYYDADGTTSLIVDRGQARVFVIDRNGTLTGMKSIEQRGSQRAADAYDPLRIDAALHTYFVEQGGAFRANGGRGTDSIPLIRFDVAQQKPDTIAQLFQTRPTIVSTQGRMTFSRTPLFSPADSWAVMPDGSIALVRATPYRVDWMSPAGERTVGRAISYTPVAVTEADKEPPEGSATATIGGGPAGGRQTTMSTADMKPEYAKVKPAFDPLDLVVAPDGRLWVGRQEAAGAKQALYDVFDRKGARVDRVAFPARSRVVGFGPSAVFVAELDRDDVPTIRKYRLTP